MRRRIIILVLALLCIEFGYGQQEFEKELLAEELAYFHAPSDSVRTRCVLNKINILLTENVVSDRLFFEIKRVENEWVLEEEKVNLYWNISLACYLLDEYYYYQKYANRYREIEGTTTELELLDFLACVKREEAKAEKLLEKLVVKDSTLGTLSSLVTANNHESRFKVLARIGAVVLPGTGLFVVKKPTKGLTSMALNTGTVFAIRYLIQNSLYINSVGWGMNLIQRFYLGGMTLTEKMIAQKEAKEKAHLADEAEDALVKVLSKYPLDFKD